MDNVLDVVGAPAALIAGTVVSAAVMTDLPPMIKWTTAVIAGGGAAGLTQGLTSLLRAKSTVMTAGLGNHVIATGELGGALLIALLALAAPLAWQLRHGKGHRAARSGSHSQGRAPTARISHAVRSRRVLVPLCGEGR